VLSTPSHPRLTPLCSGLNSPRLFSPNIWHLPCSKFENNPDDATQAILSASPPRRILTQNLPPKTNCPRTPSPPLLKVLSIQPSVTSSRSTYTNQPTCPPPQQDPAKTMEALAQPKPMEVLHTNHPREHLCQYKVIERDVELEQVHVQDWGAEASEDEATEEELLRVQQDIERLRQEQESIMRWQASFQHGEARWQHINRESKAHRATIHCRHPSPARAEVGTSFR
jgi:hypothetical protein